MSHFFKFRIQWNALKNLNHLFITFLGSAGFIGLMPIAPGTWGTLMGIPLWYLALSLNPGAKILLWVSVLIVGSWAAGRFDEIHQTKDNKHIVIDEVLGFGIASWLTPNEPFPLILTFLLFRIFDILKLPPVRAVDRWSKTTQKSLIHGFGVMADDLLAGAQALLVYALINHLIR